MGMNYVNQNTMNVNNMNNNMNQNNMNFNINKQNNINPNMMMKNINNQQNNMNMNMMPQNVNTLNSQQMNTNMLPQNMQNINNPQNNQNNMNIRPSNLFQSQMNQSQMPSMIQSMSSQISKMSIQNNQNLNNQNIQNNQNKPVNQKQRLFLKMTNEERGTFSSLFQMADKENKGKLPAKDAADFLKKSNLPKEILRQIWIISAQTDFNFLERDEFYIALRLVALAQNNFPVNSESIRNNNPLPPLPKFDLKKKNIIEDESLFELNDNDKSKYFRFFNLNKEGSNKISLMKCFQMWKSTNISKDNIKKIINLCQPFNDNNYLNLKEFQVCTHLVFKSSNNELPLKLPECLSKYLRGEDVKPKSNNELDLGINLNLGNNNQINNQSNTNNNPILNNQMNNNLRYQNIPNQNSQMTLSSTTSTQATNLNNMDLMK